MKILRIFGLYSGSFLFILGYFLKVKVQNGGYFLWLLKFQIFGGGGCLKYIFEFLKTTKAYQLNSCGLNSLTSLSNLQINAFPTRL